MKKIFLYFIMLLAVSCMKTEIINAPLTRSVDSVYIKPEKIHKDIITDTTNVDTTYQRIPIEFDPTIDDWDEGNIDI